MLAAAVAASDLTPLSWTLEVILVLAPLALIGNARDVLTRAMLQEQCRVYTVDCAAQHCT